MATAAAQMDLKKIEDDMILCLYAVPNMNIYMKGMRRDWKELAVVIRDTNDHRHQSCMTDVNPLLPPLSYSAMRLFVCTGR